MRRLACPNSKERDTHRLMGPWKSVSTTYRPLSPAVNHCSWIVADQERNQIATALFQCGGCIWGDCGHPSSTSRIVPDLPLGGRALNKGRPKTMECRYLCRLVRNSLHICLS